MMETRTQLDDFLSSMSTRRAVLENTNVAEPTQEDLTEDEQRELVVQAMFNLGIAAPQEEPTPEPEPETPTVQPERWDGIPRNERPVETPDYTNVREETLRFSDANWFKQVQEKVVILAGMGGIGSNMAIILAKLHPASIYMFDGDVVETVNMAGQLYSNEDVGMPKVEAIARTIQRYTNNSSIVALNRYFALPETIVGDIMICGFDSMTARQNYFTAWKNWVDTKDEEGKKDCLFMDGRLTATEFQIFCFTGADEYYIEEYKNKYLFPDYRAMDVPCSFKQTGYLAQMIGSFMVNLFVNFCANQVNPMRGMSLPFLTSYRGDMMYLELRR